MQGERGWIRLVSGAAMALPTRHRDVASSQVSSYYFGMTTINMHDAKTQLSDLVARAEAGEEIVIARRNKPAGKLVPVEAAEKPLCAKRARARLARWGICAPPCKRSTGLRLCRRMSCRHGKASIRSTPDKPGS